MKKVMEVQKSRLFGRLHGRMVSAALAMVLAASALAGCSGKKTAETAVQATRVQTQSAARGTLELTGTYIGTVAPHNSVNVTPLVSGTVKTVNVQVGDTVKEGDVLCQFDDTAADLQLRSAEDAVDSAKAGKEAAQDQIDSAKKQTDASITSMEGQVTTLEAQKEASEKQLKQLKESLGQLEDAKDAASEAYAAAKKIYESANALYIQYQAFLSANPDCATTAGLTMAAAPLGTVQTQTTGTVETMSADSTEETDTGAGEGTDTADPTAVDAAAVQKQETAAALLEALGEIPLTVEYLTEAGLNTLKDQMQQAEDANTAAVSGYTTAASSIAQLESSISQIDAQIDALEDNIRATKKAARSSTGTKAYDAQIKAAQTGVDSAQYQKDLYTVTSPIDGIVESVSVSENEVAAQGYPAFTISDKEAMEVSFYVPEDVRDYLKTGDVVMVEAGDGEVKGRVTSIGTAVDAQKGLFEIKAEITQVTDNTFSSNTSVSLSLVVNSVENQILIPFDAVYYDNDQAYVFVVERDGDGTKASRRDVRAGLYNNDEIAILEGLSEGEEVITTWGAGLKDGAPVVVIGEETQQ